MFIPPKRMPSFQPHPPQLLEAPWSSYVRDQRRRRAIRCCSRSSPSKRYRELKVLAPSKRAQKRLCWSWRSLDEPFKQVLWPTTTPQEDEDFFYQRVDWSCPSSDSSKNGLPNCKRPRRSWVPRAERSSNQGVNLSRKSVLGIEWVSRSFEFPKRVHRSKQLKV